MSEEQRDVDPAAVERALAELREPEFDATRRFLTGPGPTADADGRPRVARTRRISDDSVLVWFVGDRYPLNLVVEVARTGGAWRAAFAQPDAHTRLALRIVSESLEPDAITSVLGMAPSRQALAGHRFDGEAVATRSGHLWVRDVMPDSPAPIEEKLEALLRIVEPHRHALVDLRGQATTAVAIAWHGDAEAMQGLELPASMLARLGALGLTLDLDLYAETLGVGEPES